MNYIRSHWQGNSSLAIAFWVNFLLLWIVLNYVEQFTLPPYIRGEYAVTVAAVLYFVVVRLLVYLWQVVGVLRACDRRVAGLGDRLWARAAQGAVVLSLLPTLIGTFGTYQTISEYRQSFRPPALAELQKKYTLDLIEDGTLIHLKGTLEIGVTRDVSNLLEEYPAVAGIVLDSDGGQVYEGRGLAKLIQANALATYSLEHCMSACTTAFIGGTTRILGANAKLGFHRYKTYSVYPPIDVDSEQAKDMEVFSGQGIDPTFLTKMYNTSHDEMWYPDIDELLSAGVVHQVGFTPRSRE